MPLHKNLYCFQSNGVGWRKKLKKIKKSLKFLNNRPEKPYKEVIMSKIKKILVNIWKDESGQGATEYIMMLVLVAVVVLVFRKQIVGIIQKQSADMSGKISTFMSQIVP